MSVIVASWKNNFASYLIKKKKVLSSEERNKSIKIKMLCKSNVKIMKLIASYRRYGEPQD